MTTLADTPSVTGERRILWRMVIAVILANAFIIGLAATSARQSKLKYQESALVNTLNLSQTIEQYVSGIIDKIDYGLSVVKYDVERQLENSSVDNDALNRYLAQHQQKQPVLEGLRIGDLHGEVIFGTKPSSAIQRNISDRDYFIRHRDSNEEGLVISQPYISRVTGKLSVFFSRRINSPGEKFYGIAYSVITVDSFIDFFSKIDVGPLGSISLRDQNMTIVAHHPGNVLANDDITPELKLAIAHGKESDTYFGVDSRDGIERTTSFRKAGNYPFFINIDLSSDDYLAPWRDEVVKSAIICTIFCFVTLVWAVSFYRNWHDRITDEQVARQTLEQRVAEKTTSLREYAEALERSNADLEQFAYIASHDLREPLRMVTSYLGLVERRYGGLLDKDGHEFIGFAKEGAVRMDCLVTDLLEFSRIGRHAGPQAAADMDEILADVKRVLSEPITQTGTKISVPNSLPKIVCCSHEIFQLFQNLISNAIKFRAPDRTPEIQITTERQEKHWRFSVADNGIGIEPEYFNRIFLIFQRLHTRDQYDGTGIGLAVCKKIIERHGGTIWVDSVPGQGTKFSFTIPDIVATAP